MKKSFQGVVTWLQSGTFSVHLCPFRALTLRVTYPEKRFALTKGYQSKLQLCKASCTFNSLNTKILLSSKTTHDIQPRDHQLSHSILHEHSSYCNLHNINWTKKLWNRVYITYIRFLMQEDTKLSDWLELMSVLWNSRNAKLSNFLWHSGQQFVGVL